MRFKLALFLLLSLPLAACSQPAETSSTESAPPLSPEAARGQKLFSRECGSCHSLFEDTVIIGPSLHGIATRAHSRVDGQDAPTYLMTALLRPCDYLVEGFECLMPENFARKLTGEDIDAIIAFLLTLE